MPDVRASPFGPLDGFGADARQALTAARAEAERLHHVRIGTEHLLLGLLTDESSSAAEALRHAGISLAAARHKVAEAVGASTGSPEPGTTPTTKRASRAVERAVRMSHQRRSDVVTSDDVLQAVLNVEGTAGQVLRGLGVDVDQLIRRREQPAPDTVPVEPVEVRPEVAMRCPSCGEELGQLQRRVVTAEDADGGTCEAQVFSCAHCGVALGVAPV